MMREAMQQLQQETDSELARVLDKSQFKRLHEIQLQAEGPSAVLREDVAEKLEINEEQHAEIQGILSEANAARRQIMTKNFQFMRSLMPAPAGGTPPAQGGPAATAAGGQNGGQNGQAGAGAGCGRRARRTRGHEGARGGHGAGRAGQAGQNRPRFDPAEMQKIMEKPEVKAKMEEARKEQQQLRDKEYAMVYKAMDRRQVSAFKKMLGKPFDVDSLTQGFFRGGPGRNGPNAGGPQAKDAAKAAPATTGTEAKADTKTSTTTKQATTPRRQSLRERRGLGRQPPADPPGN